MKKFSILFLLGLICCQMAWLQPADSQPNIIFFLADDVRFDFIGCTGHPVVKTPNLDRLAKQGARFDEMYVNTSTCWVSRATLFTGLYLSPFSC
jgi:choline-sulfatase